MLPTLLQDIPADSGNFLWYMTDSIAVLEDSYSEVVMAEVATLLANAGSTNSILSILFVTVLLCEHEPWQCRNKLLALV